MHLPPAAEVRAARSLQVEPTLENSDEILHDDMDVEPARVFLDSDAPNLIVIDPSTCPRSENSRRGIRFCYECGDRQYTYSSHRLGWERQSADGLRLEYGSIPRVWPQSTIPSTIFAPCGAITQTPVIDWVGNINQQTDFDWNMVPSPESGLSPHLLAQSLPYALPNPESSNTTSMLDMPLSHIGEIPDQRSGFEMTQGVLSPRLQHTSGQVPAPVEPSYLLILNPHPHPGSWCHSSWPLGNIRSQASQCTGFVDSQYELPLHQTSHQQSPNQRP